MPLNSSTSEVIQKLVINPKIGLYHDLELGVDIPIVLKDSTSLSFADGVTPANSTVAPGERCSHRPQSVGDWSLGIGRYGYQFAVCSLQL